VLIVKRFLVTILAFLYLASVSGATVHLHYCMGQLIGASLVHNDKDEHRCPRCGMANKLNNGCCKDVHKIIKTGQTHTQGTTIAFAPVKLIATSPVAFYNFDVLVNSQGIDNILLSNSPPSKWRSCPIYIQVRNFRI